MLYIRDEFGENIYFSLVELFHSPLSADLELLVRSSLGESMLWCLVHRRCSISVLRTTGRRRRWLVSHRTPADVTSDLPIWDEMSI